jgi:hypothetical protein
LLKKLARRVNKFGCRPNFFGADRATKQVFFESVAFDRSHISEQVSFYCLSYDGIVVVHIYGQRAAAGPIPARLPHGQSFTLLLYFYNRVRYDMEMLLFSFYENAEGSGEKAANADGALLVQGPTLGWRPRHTARTACPIRSAAPLRATIAGQLQ